MFKCQKHFSIYGVLAKIELLKNLRFQMFFLFDKEGTGGISASQLKSVCDEVGEFRK